MKTLNSKIFKQNVKKLVYKKTDPNFLKRAYPAVISPVCDFATKKNVLQGHLENIENAGQKVKPEWMA